MNQPIILQFSWNCVLFFSYTSQDIEEWNLDIISKGFVAVCTVFMI